MNQPVEPAYFARLNAATAEINRRKQEVLEGVMAALAAQKEGRDHPRLWTPARKAEQREARRLKRIALDTAFFPRLPQIIVTQPTEDWRDFTNTIRGRFGATRQE
ncbi:hypothetical protein [Pantoea sp.]|uniref:hypothetical protein n=1 Tax=Pantoea sp. TaxID=69393 RepID=UPI0028B2528A|nr:hypothetical protein [Pantoea sp.]